MQTLQTLINLLEKGRNLHISVLDLSGVLTHHQTTLEQKNVIHSKPVCNLAKSTKSGFQACMLNKAKANQKAIDSGEAFCGHCIYGIFEYAMPVIINNKVSAIVYVGNAILDPQKTAEKLKSNCSVTGVPEEEMRKQLLNCERINSSEELFNVAEIVSDYLKMLYKSSSKPNADVHWIVALMKQHADEHFSNEIHIKDIAITYKHNEKYIGRLFKSELGISFSEYCNELRLGKAKELISEGKKRMIDIAMECGFDNVTYFNRLFKKKFGVSPSKYKA